MLKKNLFIVGATIMFVLIVLISFPYTGIAYAQQGCSYPGAWYGYNPDGDLEWTIIVQGQSRSSGTLNLEDPSFDLTLGGNFPDAVRGTDMRGIWERSGSNTFRFTMIGFAVDENGQSVWIGKLDGQVTIMEDCNQEFIELTLEVFLPNEDPFTDEPLFPAITLPSHYGYRIKVD